MTVCVAAIFNSGIIGASDRMLTAGDIQFQPPQPKIWPITNSIVAMIAGDVSVHAEIFSAMQSSINDRIIREPNNWLAVKDVANMYCQGHATLQSKMAAQKYLSPLGLDANTFIAHQKEMNTDLVRMLSTQIIDYKIPQTEVIFAGIDTSGPHLYVARNGNISCEDRVGFTAVGVGNWHAESLFMAAGHTPTANNSKTLYLTYAAKKRAEIAPGVGTETDMFVMGPALGTYGQIHEYIIRDLEKFYNDSVAERKKIDADIDTKVQQYVDDLTNAAKPSTQEAPDGKPPSNI